jgi:pantoate--beta-alanine ligase
MRIDDPRVARALCRKARARGLRVAFVPTMGCFHEGHLSLMRSARTDSAYVVVSVFVNPTQFGAGEDYHRYPRDLARDEQLARDEGVDLLFTPQVSDLYPEGYNTYVEVEGLSRLLCGASRPTHFRGVATIVAKLLNMVEPDVLFLGRKDAQQAVILQRMVEDLNFPCQVVVCPTVREADGLAMSSRNMYLSPDERRQALSLFQSLRRGCDLAVQGERSAPAILSAISDTLEGHSLVEVEYVVAVDPATLQPVPELREAMLLALAARVGCARLIDNAIIRVRDGHVDVEL